MSAPGVERVPPDDRPFRPECGEPIRVVSVGLGAIGFMAARRCLEAEDLDLVGAVDPAKAGDVLGPVSVVGDLSDAGLEADVALVATGSSLRLVAGQLEEPVRLRIDIVSTCEELSFPWQENETLAARLDELALAAGRRIVGCGVNPGFMLDVLPSRASLRVKGIRAVRSVNLDRRRPQLKAKVGVGLTGPEWLEQADQFGHRGLVESAPLCAAGVGWRVREYDFQRLPITRDGLVAGVRELATVVDEQDRRIDLELIFVDGGVDTDAIEIDGSPPLRVVFDGGVYGDEATVALMLHCARVIGDLPPGLRSPLDVLRW